MVTLEIFQDLFTPCWSAIIKMNDTVNYIMGVPIKPGSVVSIYIDTDTGSRTSDGNKLYTFTVYRIADRVFKNQMQQSYRLFCASQGFLLNQTKRVQKTYDNIKPENAMANIVSEFLGGSLDAIPSDNNYHIVIPNWSPFTACNYISKVAIKNNASDYIFYMQDTDAYCFKPLEYLYTSYPSGISFSMSPSDVRDATGDFLFDYSTKITKYRFEHFDGLSNLGAGYYQNKLVSYDMVNKESAEKNFKFGDDNAQDAQMKPWSASVFDNAESANVSFLPKHPGLHKSATPTDSQETWNTSRKSSIMKLEQDKLIIQVPGGAACWQWLGKGCTVDLPSQQDKIFADPLDRQYKGDYVITGLKHIIQQDYYTLNVECVKKRTTLPFSNFFSLF